MTYQVNESDWRLFRKRLAEWQENHMEALIEEYAAIIAGSGAASKKFWALEKRINADKHQTGVIARMSRSNMVPIINNLLLEGVITLDDLDGFSEELREQLAYVVGKNHKL